MSSRKAACPVCNALVLEALLEEHVNQCLDSGVDVAPAVAAPAVRQEDEDEALARMLQAQEDEASGRGRGNVSRCELCTEQTQLDDIYILDECNHRFCKKCIRKYVAEKLQTSVAFVCPLASCAKRLSVRDMQDLMPKKEPGAKPPQQSSRNATKRLMDELRHITTSQPEKNGYSVEIVKENLYLWKVAFFDFDKTEPIAKDMAAMHVKEIVLHIVFPTNYPYSPPFVRVIRPRFAFHTGHVTIGGSICMELLTNKGWSAENTVEAVCMSMRSSFLAGSARLDLHNRTDYTEREAKDAFDRLVREHGWY
eukprot:TRINITY_DN2630_c0_g2_i1.p1 TRINITY_DN2630_c0_g2~~TRINITY_DN2630_c0_g2_i1.p1  ORF type:complete len:325 (-),score=104.58 TRINITY_DN2630_c0_g2_i1:165-1091(-)